MRRPLVRDLLLGLALCLILIAILIATTDAGPQWIYQSF